MALRKLLNFSELQLFHLLSTYLGHTGCCLAFPFLFKFVPLPVFSGHVF